MNESTSSARWARWEWAGKKLGRWHRLFTDGDLTKTACQTPRKDAKHSAVQTAGQPTGGAVCPTCSLFDSLHKKLVTTTDAVATDSIPTFTLADILTAAPVASQATDGRPVAPAGICGCGCQQSDVARAYRTELKVWEAAEAARKQAEFETYLAAKAVVA
jgi:hypothetical protein